MKRFIYTRVEPIVYPLRPQEQAGFRRGRSIVDQVTLLTQEIEDSFSAKKKAGAVFVDITVAYDTVGIAAPHLQNPTPPARQAHGIIHHGAFPKSQLHPHHW